MHLLDSVGISSLGSFAVGILVMEAITLASFQMLDSQFARSWRGGESVCVCAGWPMTTK